MSAIDGRAHPRAGLSTRALRGLEARAKQFAFMKVKCYEICNGPDRLPPPDPKTRSRPEPRQSSMGLFLFFVAPTPGRAIKGRGGCSPRRDRASNASLPLRDTKVLGWFRLSPPWRLGLVSHRLLGLLTL